MLFVDFTSAVITVSPMKLTGKLNWTWLPRSATGYWAGLTSRPWRVHIGIHNSSTLVLNTGAPQGCVLSLLLFTLYTTTALPDFKRTTPHLLFSVSKTKELVVEFRKKEAKTHTAVYMSGAEVEQVNISTRQSPAWCSMLSFLWLFGSLLLHIFSYLTPHTRLWLLLKVHQWALVSLLLMLMLLCNLLSTQLWSNSNPQLNTRSFGSKSSVHWSIKIPHKPPLSCLLLREYPPTEQTCTCLSHVSFQSRKMEFEV